MATQEIFLIDFTITAAAWTEIDKIRRAYDEKYLDKADVAMIAWGTTMLHDGRSWDGVIVGFYGKSERHSIEHGIQILDGRELVFFVNVETKDRFFGRTVDFVSEKGFYLL